MKGNILGVSNSRTGMLVSLAMSRIAPQTSSLLTSLLLIEIGLTFGTPVGVTNQIKSITSVFSFVTALAMGLLSVRYNHRKLLIAGLFVSILSSLGCCFAPSFITLVAVYALGGVGGTMIFPMTTSLVGQHVPKERRSNAIGILMASGAFLYLVGAPIVSNIGDWRQSFMLFSTPTLIISLILSLVFIPKTESSNLRSNVLDGYSRIASNSSALASLLGQAFGVSVWAITLTLAFSFFREVFQSSRTFVIYITFGTALAYMAGAIFSSRIISRFGVKKSAIGSLILMGFFSLIYLSGYSLFFSFGVCILMCFFSGLNASALQGLNLDQIPDQRGSMMSLVSAFGSIGNIMSLTLGGFVLVLYGWSTLGGLVALFSVLGVIILHFFVKEPE